MKTGGFLGPSVQRWIKVNRRGNAAFFSIAEDLNAFAHELVLEAAGKLGGVSKGVQERLAMGLLLRGVETFQSIVILAERGMVSEMAVLSRSLMEAGIRLSVVAMSPADADQLVVNDEFDQKTRLEEALKIPASFTPEQRNQTQKRIKWLDNRLTGKSRKNHQLEQMAHRTGHSDIYRLFYRYYSPSVHSLPSGVKKHVGTTPNHEKVTFQMGPKFEFIPFYLSAATFLHLKFLEVAMRFFAVDRQTKFELLSQRLKSFGPHVRPPPWP